MVINDNYVVEGSQEWSLLMLAANGGREFSMLGNEYIITEVTFEKHAFSNFIRDNGNTTTIKAVKRVSAKLPNNEEHF